MRSTAVVWFDYKAMRAKNVWEVLCQTYDAKVTGYMLRFFACRRL